MVLYIVIVSLNGKCFPEESTPQFQIKERNMSAVMAREPQDLIANPPVQIGPNGNAETTLCIEQRHEKNPTDSLPIDEEISMLGGSC
ncbi:hypothetical protein NQ314_014763 [Rhamnusium bicolor]|uniref:Uncharacterized protein n=1 Tax=Rhamnusium bicolor TaxID=1586634 RepID=A0AAV8X077_9CUCU|nr:hypothetical protein NQ314_014763 [Rhamnusium bicolor]